MRRRVWLTSFLLVALAAACGDDNTDERTDESTTTAAPSPSSLPADETAVPTTSGDSATEGATSTEVAADDRPLGRDTVFVIDGPRLWRIDPESGERSSVIELDATEQIRSAALSDDGVEVLVVSERSEPQTSTLWVAPVDGSSPTRLIHLEGETRITSARLSPDAEQVLTVRESRVDYAANLFVTDREGDDVRLTDLPDDEAIQNPSILDEQFSPDGRTVLFGLYDWPSDTSDLFAVSVSGGDLRPLTAPDDQGSAGSAFFSSDGSRVVYVSTIEGSRSDLFTVSVSGGEPTRLTSTGEDEIVWLEAVHPDGTTLLLSVRDAISGPGIAGGRLLLVDLDGTDHGSVFSVENGETLGRADFVLGESTILFDMTGDRTNALFTVDMTGQNRTAVTDPEGWVVFHEVSPSGNRVLYRAEGDTTATLLDLRNATTIQITGNTAFFAG